LRLGWRGSQSHDGGRRTQYGRAGEDQSEESRNRIILCEPRSRGLTKTFVDA
jgi:hypothetical protein